MLRRKPGVRGAFLAVTLLVLGIVGTAASAMSADNGRVVGGSEVAPGANRFVAALLDTARGSSSLFGARASDEQFCGGSLIDASHVLTAAHCVAGIFPMMNPETLDVLVGTTDLDRPSAGQRRNVSLVVVHPWYAPRTSRYDVAVLRLSVPVEGIVPHRLPRTGQALPSTGTLLLVAGWGSLSENGSSSSRMHEVDVPASSNKTCQSAYRLSDGFYATVLCAGFPSGGKDSCFGDSGGPLWRGTVQIGIVSFGDGCARPKKPGVYARVASPPIHRFVDLALAEDSASAVKRKMGKEPTMDGGRR